jgi:hypothetical protein
MIACTVCGTENDELAVVCVSCKSFLQMKVDNLNLFATLWGLMESPKSTLRKIVLARHKNYAYVLPLLFGIALVYAFFWYRNFGARFYDLASLIAAGLVVGPLAGLAFALVFSFVTQRVGRLLGGKGTFRNVFAVTSYAATPIVYSLVFVFPIEVAVFGVYFFGNNPPPLVIQPVIYVILLVFDGAALLWTFILLTEGTAIAIHLTRAKAVILTSVMIGLTGLAAYALKSV